MPLATKICSLAFHQIKYHKITIQSITNHQTSNTKFHQLMSPIKNYHTQPIQINYFSMSITCSPTHFTYIPLYSH